MTLPVYTLNKTHHVHYNSQLCCLTRSTNLVLTVSVSVLNVSVLNVSVLTVSVSGIIVV